MIKKLMYAMRVLDKVPGSLNNYNLKAKLQIQKFAHRIKRTPMMDNKKTAKEESKDSRKKDPAPEPRNLSARQATLSFSVSAPS